MALGEPRKWVGGWVFGGLGEASREGGETANKAKLITRGRIMWPGIIWPWIRVGPTAHSLTSAPQGRMAIILQGGEWEGGERGK